MAFSAAILMEVVYFLKAGGDSMLLEKSSWDTPEFGGKKTFVIQRKDFMLLMVLTNFMISLSLGNNPEGAASLLAEATAEHPGGG